jgi:hypothetical protein
MPGHGRIAAKRAAFAGFRRAGRPQCVRAAREPVSKPHSKAVRLHENAVQTPRFGLAPDLHSRRQIARKPHEDVMATVQRKHRPTAPEAAPAEPVPEQASPAASVFWGDRVALWTFLISAGILILMHVLLHVRLLLQ